MAVLAKTFKFAEAALAAMVIGEKHSKKHKSCKTKLSVQKQKEVRSIQDQTIQLTQQTPEVSNCGFGLDRQIQITQDPENMTICHMITRKIGWTIFLFSCKCNLYTSYMSLTLVCCAIVK